MNELNSENNSTFLPYRFKLFLLNRLKEIIGFLLIFISLLTFFSLVFFNSNDPIIFIKDVSYDIVENPLGIFGSYLGGVFIHLFGLGSFLLIISFFLWGIRLILHEKIKLFKLKLFLLIPILMVLCIPLSNFDFINFNYPQSNGGIVGKEFLNLIPNLESFWKNNIFPDGRWPLSLLIFIIFFPVFLWVSSASKKEIYFINTIIKIVLFPFYKSISSIMYFFEKFFLRKYKNSPLNIKPYNRKEPELLKEVNRNQKIRKDVVNIKKPRQVSLNLEDSSGYFLPDINLLNSPSTFSGGPERDVLDANSRMLENVLDDFGVKGEINEALTGPVVTRYDYNPSPGTKTSRIVNLADDIARSMSAISVRAAVVPGKNVIGIELPNINRETVVLKEILESENWFDSSFNLPLALGKDIAGLTIIRDLSAMPHLLVAGTTGSGKSVAINAMILSLLYKHTPDTCKLILVDPKMLELSVYDGIPHLLTPVVTEPSKAVMALKWAVREMEERYKLMSKLNVRNISGFNKQITNALVTQKTLSHRVQTGFDNETGKPTFEEEDIDLKTLPYIVIVIDEVADLMLVAGKEIEAAVQRLAQMARAAGIHVIMATQRPSVDVITGTIKANFPTRMSFQVFSKVDSRTILGEQGGEQLLGKGDMLFMEGGGKITRVHGPFVSDFEVEKVVKSLKDQGNPDYDDKITVDYENDKNDYSAENFNHNDKLYDQAVAIIAKEQKASTSFIQRHLRIGYNRAATIIEKMEADGIISKANHVGKRDVLINDQ